VSDPYNDHRFLRLSSKAREQIIDRLCAMAVIAINPGNDAVMRSLVENHKGERGWSRQNIRKLWAKYNANNGDWTVLVDRARVPRQQAKLPAAFIEYLQCLFCHSHAFRFAWVQLKQQFEQWREGNESCAIPGYETCPEPSSQTGIPVGWSYQNLHRVVRDSLLRHPLMTTTKKGAQ